ncbi:MAG: rRNA maturation RNase YbeY [Candidatus Borkfalkiaceae bacterium]|nr:rRNA maturation RNase YbeY [Christensenellaceae bacterium]
MKGNLLVITDNCPIDCESLAEAVYRKLGQTDELAVELSFVSPEEIRDLNGRFRGVDRVTDVLSFPYLDGVRHRVIDRRDFPCDVDEETGRVLIGSVCVCTERAAEQAESYGHSLKRELTYLALHGFLHCFGYDHIVEEDEREMSALAEEIMREIGVGRDEG